jgi:hypothetical protein
MSRYPEFPLSSLKPQSIKDRKSLVRVEQFAKPMQDDPKMSAFLDCLPLTGAAESLLLLAQRIRDAKSNKRSIVVGIGGHVIKCGLAPILIQLMEEGYITCLAMNGAAAIHDVEIALYGCTSENVEDGLRKGTFGMCRDTHDFMNGVTANAFRRNGIGEQFGSALNGTVAPFACSESMSSRSPGDPEPQSRWDPKPFVDMSVLASADRLGIPATVHVAIGTDINHLGFGDYGMYIGDTTMRDFRILVESMRNLSDGGVLINIGSSVILPEVFLKGIAMHRNVDLTWGNFTGADLDMIRSYRGTTQLVDRMEAVSSTGIALTGCHEIMLPLLAAAVLGCG